MLEELAQKVNQQILTKNIEWRFKKGLLSVSKCLGKIKPAFDKEKMSKHCFEKYYEDESSNYYHKTQEEILAMWDAKAAQSLFYGKMLDTYTEFLFKGSPSVEIDNWKTFNKINESERLTNICAGFDKYIADIKLGEDLIFIGREIPLYITNDKGQAIQGRMDCLMYDLKNQKLVVIDWKTSEEIKTFNQYNKKLLGPCYKLDECDANVYTLQTHLYKKALSETYKICPVEQIQTYVCQLGYNNQPDYHIYPDNIAYDNNLLNDMIDFAYDFKI